MQQTSSLYRRLISDENHWFESTLVIGSGGDLITENGDKIIFGGWAIDVAGDSPGYGYNENQIMSIRTSTQVLNDGIAIGNCISQEIEVEMLKPSGELPRMSMITPYVRVAGEVEGNYTWEIVDGVLTFASYAAITDSILTIAPTSGSSIIDGILYLPQDVTGTESEWLKQGEFFIDTKPCSHNDNGLEIMTIHGYDAMLKGNQYYTESKLSWPSRDILVLNEIAEMMGVEIDDRTRYLIGNLYPIEYPGGSYTLLETLGIIGSMYLGNWIITEQGKLRLISFADLPKETRYLTDNIGDILLFGVDRQESEVEVSGGAIASFDTDVYEMTELVADIDPQQDLHGYDAPWPAGGGKNKCPLMPTTTVNGVTFTQREDGGYGLSGTADGNSILDIGRGSWTLPAGTYYGSIIGTSNISSTTIWKIVDGTASLLVTGDGSFTLTETTSVFFRLFVANGTTASGVVYVQVESGSSMTAFAPYSNICPISGWDGLNVWVENEYDPTAEPTVEVSWETEAGTVYAGTLDVVSGLLTVDRVSVEYDGSSDERWLYSSGWSSGANTNAFYLEDALPNALFSSLDEVFCISNLLPAVSRNDLSAKDVPSIGYSGISYPYLTVRVFKSSASTAEEFKTWLQSNHLQVVYMLAQQQTYQLTPQHISTIAGHNNVFADTGNIESLKYLVPASQADRILV